MSSSNAASTETSRRGRQPSRADGSSRTKIHGAAPAPYRALELISSARTASREDGFAAEDEADGELIMSEEFRASVYAFDLVQRRAKRPVGAPDRQLARAVTKVGIVGAGLMASQLGLLFVRRLEVPVVLTDLDQERVDKGVGSIHAEIGKLRAKGRLSTEQATRLTALVTGSTDVAGFADADFVLEAVYEDMKVKQEVLAELETVVAPECVLATNTSALSVTQMAANLAHPSASWVSISSTQLPSCRSWRSSGPSEPMTSHSPPPSRSAAPAEVLRPGEDAPASSSTGLTRFIGEITRAVDDGTPVEVADRATEPLGLPMSPFLLLQLVGPAVALHVTETLHEAFPDRFTVSENLRRLVASGRSHFLSWDEQGRSDLDDQAKALFEQGGVARSEQEVRETALTARPRDPAHPGRRRGRRSRRTWTCACSWRGLAVPPRRYAVPGPHRDLRARDGPTVPSAVRQRGAALTCGQLAFLGCSGGHSGASPWTPRSGMPPRSSRRSPGWPGKARPIQRPKPPRWSATA